jgi:hypothetical protein
MQKELPDQDSVAAEIAFEIADVFVTILKSVFPDQLRWELLSLEVFAVNANDECFLVVTAVKDADAATLRQALDAAPEVIVIEIVARGRGDLVFAYRQSNLDDLVILSCEFELEREDSQELTKRMQKQWHAFRDKKARG